MSEIIDNIENEINQSEETAADNNTTDQTTANAVDAESVVQTPSEAIESEQKVVMPVSVAMRRPKDYEDISKIEPKWYILHTYSGYENIAKENLIAVFEKNNIQDRLSDIRIPMEDVVEEKGGKRKVVHRRMFPSYVIIKMKYTRDMWHLITGTRGVTGFVGPQGKPCPLTDDEVRRMKLETPVAVKTDLAVGDQIKVMQGPLSDMTGEIKNISSATGKCSVEINMFGRLVPAELDITQVEKFEG